VTRVVAYALPFSRGPWLVGATAFLVAGLGAIAWRVPVVGWPAVAFGAALLLLAGRPAEAPRERIVLDDRGVTDLLGNLGPIPWADIMGARVQYLGRFKVIAVEVRNPEYWEARLPERYRRLGVLAAQLNLPPVLLAGQGLDPPAEDVVRVITERLRT
jgi:hypothetical protein